MGVPNQWIVEMDPTNEFTGAEFDTENIKRTAVWGYWPNGITFKNISTGEIAEYKNYKVKFNSKGKGKSNGTNNLRL